MLLFASRWTRVLTPTSRRQPPGSTAVTAWIFQECDPDMMRSRTAAGLNRVSEMRRAEEGRGWVRARLEGECGGGPDSGSVGYGGEVEIGGGPGAWGDSDASRSHETEAAGRSSGPGLRAGAAGRGCWPGLQGPEIANGEQGGPGHFGEPMESEMSG